jgi:hypothetical protein
LEQMAISGVRSVPKNTNSATTLKSSPAQFVHTAPYVVRHCFGATYFEIRLLA